MLGTLNTLFYYNPPASRYYSHFRELKKPSFQGNEHSAQIPLFSSQETSWPGSPVNDCREEEINTSPPEADGSQDVFDFTPSPFSIKGVWILTQARWFFGPWVHRLLSLLAFRIKSLFLASTTRLLISGLSCGKQYKLRLSNQMPNKEESRAFLSAVNSDGF